MRLPFFAVPVVWTAIFATLAFAQTPSAWEEPFSQQRWTEAEPLLQRALAQSETAPALRALAALYRATGRLALADPVLERLVAREETVANLETLARTKIALAQLPRAEALYERALELRLDADNEPAASIPTRHQLAQVFMADKKFTAATQQANIAIDLRTRAFGPNHPDLASDYMLLGRIYQAQSEWDEAAAVWETVIRIQAAAYTAEDLRIADSLDNLAQCQVQSQRIGPAELSLRQALAIREYNLGPNHTDVAQTLDQIGKLLFGIKQYAGAEQAFRRTLEIYLAFLGPGNPLLARNYDNLAVTEAMLEKYLPASEHYAESLKIRDSDDVLSLRNLALLLVAQDKQSTAEPLYRRALTVLDAAAPPDAPTLKLVLTEYANLLRALNRPADAARLETRLTSAKQPPSSVPQSKRAPIAAKQK
ncbi:MAG: tetratricopeptide repeat protein [Acidobacteriota bacterium]